MTRDEIMAMTPGQLRLAIAEAKGIPLLWRGSFPHNAVTQERIPNWPNDISAAWGLVEEMPFISLIAIPHSEHPREFVCYADHYDQDALPVYGDTAPLAICRAWLMWKQEVR